MGKGYLRLPCTMLQMIVMPNNNRNQDAKPVIPGGIKSLFGNGEGLTSNSLTCVQVTFSSYEAMKVDYL